MAIKRCTQGNDNAGREKNATRSNTTMRQLKENQQAAAAVVRLFLHTHLFTGNLK